MISDVPTIHLRQCPGLALLRPEKEKGDPHRLVSAYSRTSTQASMGSAEPGASSASSMASDPTTRVPGEPAAKGAAMG